MSKFKRQVEFVMKCGSAMRLSQNRFFTLLELLMVMAIIIILFSILLPCLRNAKMIAERSGCSSNLRQLGMAANIYISDHDGYFHSEGGWYQKELIDNNYITVSDKYNGTVFRCPGWKFENYYEYTESWVSSWWNTYGVICPNWLPYSYNEALAEKYYANSRTGTGKLAKVTKSASKVILFCDSSSEFYGSAVYRGFLWQTVYSWAWLGRHMNLAGKNWLLLDQHVEFQKPANAKNKFEVYGK